MRVSGRRAAWRQADGHKPAVFPASVRSIDPILLMEAAILGIAEGLTEFLPVSGTGQLIIAGDLLGLNDQRAKVFQIAIQLAAILAVVWEYRAKIR